MSKVSSYLQSHINGEVTTRLDVRQSAARDASILQRVPEMVAYPRTTNDLRKLARFSWQLAQKGHTLPIHVRGDGAGTTGASLGHGMVVDTSRYMDQVFEYEPKQKLLRLQPGARVASLNTALRLHGTAIPPLSDLPDGTIGGAVSEDAGGRYTGRYGSVRNYVTQLEVVLDSGDLLQTGRISKREVSKLKGTQRRVGDIYRGIDTVLEDHAEFIASVQRDGLKDRSGYPGIFEVRKKDGSFDLTPLLVGSQGTLGIISELIVKSEFVAAEVSEVAVVLSSASEAFEVLPSIAQLSPASIEYFDGAILAAAAKQGNSYAWLLGDDAPVSSVVVLVAFDEFSEKTRQKRVKKLQKTLSKTSARAVVSDSQVLTEKIHALSDLAHYVAVPTDTGEIISPDVIDAVHVPLDKLEEFSANLSEIASNLHLPVYLYGSATAGTYHVLASVSLKKVTDKQKLIKLIDQVSALADGLDGVLIGAGGEGRTLSRFARANWDPEYTQLVTEIKHVFDPGGIFNPATKAEIDIKQLGSEFRSDNTARIR